uniref:Uncharacterized protein n=1 Tax=Anguilla anguilla TaxID=7936 RepID=A0A0E9WJE1_ANGAN
MRVPGKRAILESLIAERWMLEALQNGVLDSPENKSLVTPGNRMINLSDHVSMRIYNDYFFIEINGHCCVCV